MTVDKPPKRKTTRSKAKAISTPAVTSTPEVTGDAATASTPAVAHTPDVAAASTAASPANAAGASTVASASTVPGLSTLSGTSKVPSNPEIKSKAKHGPDVASAVGAALTPAATAPVDRRLMIEREAYLRAERRGFEPGHELEDWLAAELSVGAHADA